MGGVVKVTTDEGQRIRSGNERGKTSVGKTDDMARFKRK